MGLMGQMEQHGVVQRECLQVPGEDGDMGILATTARAPSVQMFR